MKPIRSILLLAVFACAARAQVSPGQIILTTNGSSGAATLNGVVLNIPQYSGGGTPGGSNKECQYNNSGAFGGITSSDCSGTNFIIPRNGTFGANGRAVIGQNGGGDTTYSSFDHFSNGFTITTEPNAVGEAFMRFGPLATTGTVLWTRGAIQLIPGGVQYTCDSTTRGMFWVTDSAAGVKDKVETCLKDSADTYNWGTGNCSSSASPAVCAAASTGSVAIPTGVTSVALTVNTTAVTANSQIFVTSDDSLGTKLGVTCNSTLATVAGGLAITARVAATSFTVTFNGTIATNPLCLSYSILN